MIKSKQVDFLIFYKKKLWNHSPAASVPTAFLVLPNFHSCFYNLIEAGYMFSISLSNYFVLLSVIYSFVLVSVLTFHKL